MPDEKAALVTGGSGGIGAAIVGRLLAAGYEVVSLDLRPPETAHPRLRWIAVDLFDAAATAEAAREATENREVTRLVHNAGVIRPDLLPAVSLDDLHALTQLHAGAAVALAQATLPAMERAGSGRVVLVSSRAALGAATRSVYAATKAGLIGLARTWALELARKGITVNVVAPGPTRSPMFHGVLPEGDPQVERLAASIPMGRIGEPEDVAHAAMFFLSEGAGFVTGQTLYVCGGLSVGTSPL